MSKSLDENHLPALGDFEGPWLIWRRIDDRLAGRPGSFEGRVRFRRDARGFVVEEEGELTMDGQVPLRASRRYFWRAARRGAIAVFFEDGRAFHEFAPGRVDEAEHLCAPDHYRVRYDFGGWPRWSAEWRVRGPRKDYLMVSHYARGS